MGNVSKRVKSGRYYYLEYFLVGFLNKLCVYIWGTRSLGKEDNFQFGDTEINP